MQGASLYVWAGLAMHALVQLILVDCTSEDWDQEGTLLGGNKMQWMVHCW